MGVLGTLPVQPVRIVPIPFSSCELFEEIWNPHGRCWGRNRRSQRRVQAPISLEDLGVFGHLRASVPGMDDDASEEGLWENTGLDVFNSVAPLVQPIQGRA